jgi:bifunctional non-homologous end joining protein LigD
MLEEYNKKGNFVRTSEPRGKTRQSKDNKARFVVQKHDATRLHYDLEIKKKEY